ncbi:hypothetical protein KFE25_002077 [Diacronema lutheri]|uniref:Fatty acid hydroxylase domain-containing protein n=1 Tax=Diacronema lutheri TaxID=2081491 RepID=A0A8J5XLD7_DIALT|nr:hypothetical protein KFE25_002077 [Diacronema lutheri]
MHGLAHVRGSAFDLGGAAAPHGKTALADEAHWVTSCVRAVHVACALLVVVDARAANAWIDVAWERVRACRVVHHCMFEALLATCAFAGWIALYKLADRTPALRHLRFRSATEHVRQGVSYTNSWVMGAGYLALIYAFHQLRTKPPLDIAPPTARRLGVEVALGVVAYDACEFCAHVLMHRVRCLHRLHRTHHAQAALTAAETLHHDTADAVQQVVLNVLVQQLSPWGAKHSLSRMVHNVLVTYMLTEIHAGYDAPWCMHRVWPALFGGAARHEVHHRDGNVYYAEFFKGFDELLGSVKPRMASTGASLSGESAGGVRRAVGQRT